MVVVSQVARERTAWEVVVKGGRMFFRSVATYAAAGSNGRGVV